MLGSVNEGIVWITLRAKWNVYVLKLSVSSNRILLLYSVRAMFRHTSTQ